MFSDISKIRQDFPILNQKINNNKLIYFDNAALTQKPKIVINYIKKFYENFNSNIHRGIYYISNQATTEYEKTRDLISKLYHCKKEEIIFTKNTTESLNLIVHTIGRQVLHKNTNIIISEMEHHSNIVPWLLLKKDLNFEIKYIPINQKGLIKQSDIKNLIDKNTKIFSISIASNVFGVRYKPEKIIKIVRKINPKTIIILDAAQYLPHQLINFKKLDADFIVFSGHKMCGPNGVGVLIGKKELLQQMNPFLGGGSMIKKVTKNYVTFNDLPYKFEAGTQNIEGIIGFGKSLEYLNNLGFENIYKYEKKLNMYLHNQLSTLNFITIYSPSHTLKTSLCTKNTPLISFNIKNIHPHDVASILDQYGVAIRAGHHCAQIAMRKLGVSSTLRCSLYFYNTIEEIDIFINALKNVYNYFK